MLSLIFMIYVATLFDEESFTDSLFLTCEKFISIFYKKDYKNARTNIYILSTFSIGIGVVMGLDVLLIRFYKYIVNFFSFLSSQYSLLASNIYMFLFKSSNDYSTIIITIMLILIVIILFKLIIHIHSILEDNSFFNELSLDLYGVNKDSKMEYDLVNKNITKIISNDNFENTQLLEKIKELYSYDIEKTTRVVHMINSDISIGYILSSIAKSNNLYIKTNDLIKNKKFIYTKDNKLMFDSGISTELVDLIDYFIKYDNKKIISDERYSKNLNQKLTIDNDFDEDTYNKKLNRINEIIFFLYEYNEVESEYRLLRLGRETYKNVSLEEINKKLLVKNKLTTEIYTGGI